MCKPYEYGGYKMIDIYTFISTLKISWLRRLNEIEGQSSTWAFLYPSLSKLSIFGQEKIVQLLTLPIDGSVH